jgi:hypothetical protein
MGKSNYLSLYGALHEAFHLYKGHSLVAGAMTALGRQQILNNEKATVGADNAVRYLRGDHQRSAYNFRGKVYSTPIIYDYSQVYRNW